jgi:phosphoribosylanthranilate isomerase
MIPLFTDVDDISFALDYYRPDIVHFCDAIIEDPHQWESLCGRMISIQATIRERFPEIAIMRSVPVPPPGGILPVEMLIFARYFEPLTDYFLTDTYITAGPGMLDPRQPVSGIYRHHRADMRLGDGGATGSGESDTGYTCGWLVA